MMNPALAELKDIHLPLASPWWQFAIGWWLLLVLMIALAWWLVPKVKKRFKQREAERQLTATMQRHLQQIRDMYERDQNLALSELSSLLRRVSLTLFANQQPAGLIGDEWLTFLDRQWPQSAEEAQFSQPRFAGLLTHGAYRPLHTSDSAVDVEELITLAEKWLTAVVDNRV